MKRGDRESNIYMTTDVMHELLLCYHSQELCVNKSLLLLFYVRPIRAAVVGAVDEGRL